MNRWNRISALLLSLLILISALSGCELISVPDAPVTDGTTHREVILLGEDTVTLQVGEGLQLRVASALDATEIVWSVSGDAVTVSQTGYVCAVTSGKAIITARVGDTDDSVTVLVFEYADTSPDDTTSSGAPDEDTTFPDDPDESTTPPSVTDVPTDTTTPDDGSDPLPLPDYSDANAFYRNYYPAVSYEDAQNRTKYGLMSGFLTVPDQEPTLAPNRLTEGGKYVRNSDPYFIDSNTYVVVDVTGAEVFRIYRGGAYITLEEVAAYVYAFGGIPANYVADKDAEPEDSIWGEYLRLNHSKFSGSTSKYPYEPSLPDINGNGGSLQYYEIDIGTTGTDCDAGYPVRIYNNGSTITRGAARIVYARYDAGQLITDPNERYVFYTYNHYNDFQEYLNYYGGWGEMFGNITGGGSLSSKYDYNPTPYVPVIMAPIGPALYEEASAVILSPALFFCAAMPTENRYAA